MSSRALPAGLKTVDGFHHCTAATVASITVFRNSIESVVLSSRFCNFPHCTVRSAWFVFCFLRAPSVQTSSFCNRRKRLRKPNGFTNPCWRVRPLSTQVSAKVRPVYGILSVTMCVTRYYIVCVQEETITILCTIFIENLDYETVEMTSNFLKEKKNKKPAINMHCCEILVFHITYEQNMPILLVLLVFFRIYSHLLCKICIIISS